jgi:hypothetical protein
MPGFGPDGAAPTSGSFTPPEDTFVGEDSSITTPVAGADAATTFAGDIDD